MTTNYDLISNEWCNARKELPLKDEALFNMFIECLPDGASVLDLGCGSAVPIAKMLSDKGLSILGVDSSKKLLQRAKKNVPNGVFQKAEIEEYQINSTYDGVVLWDSMFHIQRDRHRSILENIYNHITAGGVLILSSGGSEGEIGGFTDFMFGEEFYYDALPPQDLLLLCEDIGFTVVKNIVVNEPDGARDKGRIGVLLSKDKT